MTLGIHGMTEIIPPQITVLDTGGQYCHLIARRIRELGVLAEVCPSDTPAKELAQRQGIVISGGPSSVYDPASPKVDPAIFSLGIPVLGICYGLHTMAYLLDGVVRKADSGEFGLAHIDVVGAGHLFTGLGPREQVWMSHRDAVEKLPDGFELMGRTDACPIAAMGDADRGFYGVQFHPESILTPAGGKIIENILEIATKQRTCNG